MFFFESMHFSRPEATIKQSVASSHISQKKRLQYLNPRTDFSQIYHATRTAMDAAGASAFLVGDDEEKKRAQTRKIYNKAHEDEIKGKFMKRRHKRERE